jgi:hypothetical protein
MVIVYTRHLLIPGWIITVYVALADVEYIL